MDLQRVTLSRLHSTAVRPLRWRQIPFLGSSSLIQPLDDPLAAVVHFTLRINHATFKREFGREISWNVLRREFIMAGADSPKGKKKGKVVVITGVTKGLGRALAVELASRGHTVAGCGRSEDKLKSLETSLGPQHLFAPADVASDTSVQAFATCVMDKFGAPDIVINCAGQINPNARLWEVPSDVFNSVVDVNLKGTANVIRHFVTHMIARRSGIIVNFSSGWGRSAAAEVGPYCASKWALEGLTKSLAKELPAGLVAVALNPGVVNTDMLQSCFGASAAMYTTPDVWAPHCVSLILSISQSDNGASLTVL